MPSEPQHGTRLRSGGPARRIAVGAALAGARAQAALARPAPTAIAPGTWQLLGRVPPRTLRCRLGAARGASSCSAVGRTAAGATTRFARGAHTVCGPDRMFFTDALQRPGHVRCVPERRAQNGNALRLRRPRPAAYPGVRATCWALRLLHRVLPKCTRTFARCHSASPKASQIAARSGPLVT